ncbi:NADH-quinone oxidoreductase subunit H [Thermoleophilia bacterium SCSIO 60948]|nr:NADH-quinone oxidoreductase subunit H [Thermoleophilia bacterium SCSIO 60948]
MSDATPFAIIALALVGALALTCVEQVVAGGRPSLAPIARGALARMREPVARPETYDGWLFHLAPVLLLASAVAALAMVPWTPGFRGIELESGAILFAAALAYVTPAVFMAGWGAGRPLAVVGAFRFVALMLAYAMPIAMVITAVAAPAASLTPSAIVDVQHTVPMAVVQPYSLLLWLPAVMAVALLPPFDVATAPGELGGAGAFDRYSGLEAAIIALARRVLLLAVSGMTAALFLAGWHGPLLPDAIWMAIKTLAVAALLLWAGRVLPRIEIDRLVSLAWKVAIPGSIGAIVLAGLTTLLFYR